MKTITIVSMLISYLAFGQPEVLMKDTASTGEVTFMRFNPEVNPKLTINSMIFLRSTLKLDEWDELRLVKQSNDELGYVHDHYLHYYNGVRVEYGAYRVHSKGGTIQSIGGSFKKIEKLNTTPALTSRRALEKAIVHVGALTYRWQNENDETWIKEIKKDPSASFLPSGKLLICHLGPQENRPTLAYKFAIYASDPPSADYVYVDAISGDILRRKPIMNCSNAPGTAATKYSGQQSITTDSYNGIFRLQESGRGIGITTKNLIGLASYSGAAHFTDNDNNWTAGEFNNANMDNAALDAHWGMEKTYDYFFNVHGRNGYSGVGAATFGNVHGNMVALFGHNNNDNAVWDPQFHWAVFGDGTTRFKPLTSLDVVAHELGHGYTQYFVDPTGVDDLSDFDETPAISEGLSDIWGAVVENYSVTNKITWRIGEDIMKNGKPCSRSLENPNTGGDPAGSLTGGFPDTKGGAFWASTDPTGHTNSTVLSHWFYILSQGKSGTNDLGNFFNVTGIGITSAAKIVYRLEDVYLTATANFSEARNFAINAAIDLFCNNSKEVVSVTNAWFAVGVGASYPGSSLSIAGTVPICTSQTFNVQNQPGGVTGITWSSGNTSILTINSNSGFATRVNNSNGSVNLNATFTGTGGCTTVITRSVFVGIPATPGYPLLPLSPMCVNQTKSATIAVVPGAASFTWWSNDPNLDVGNTQYWTSALVTAYAAGTRVFTITSNNLCGSSSPRQINVGIVSCGGGSNLVIASPNPASTTLTVESILLSQTADATSTIAMDGLWLRNEQGNVVIQTTEKTTRITLPIGGLPKGFYYLTVKVGNDTEVQRIVIDR